jgi:NOL1/NOP2/fmu family ribosome biogenesis protein
MSEELDRLMFLYEILRVEMPRAAQKLSNPDRAAYRKLKDIESIIAEIRFLRNGGKLGGYEKSRHKTGKEQE